MERARAGLLFRAVAVSVAFTFLAGPSVSVAAGTMRTVGRSPAQGSQSRWAQRRPEVRSIDFEDFKNTGQTLRRESERAQRIVTENYSHDVVATAPGFGFFTWQLDRIVGHRVTLSGTEATGRIALDLIRADVEVRLATSTRIEMLVRTDVVQGIERVAIRADASANGIRISDAYPPRSGWSDECLPPPTEHGDFWLVPVRLKVTLYVPAKIPVGVKVLEGTVRDFRGDKR